MDKKCFETEKKGFLKEKWPLETNKKASKRKKVF